MTRYREGGDLRDRSTADGAAEADSARLAAAPRPGGAVGGGGLGLVGLVVVVLIQVLGGGGGGGGGAALGGLAGLGPGRAR